MELLKLPGTQKGEVWNLAVVGKSFKLHYPRSGMGGVGQAEAEDEQPVAVSAKNVSLSPVRPGI